MVGKKDKPEEIVVKLRQALHKASSRCADFGPLKAKAQRLKLRT